MKTLLVIGLLLLVVSAYPLYLMALEITVSHRAYERYGLHQHSGTNYDYKSAEFAGHHAILSDGPLFDAKPTVSTGIDGKDYSLRSPIERDERGGYHSWAQILTLTDRKNNQARLAVVQRVAGKNYPDDTRYRILFLSSDGTVSEEWFSYPDRSEPVYRAMLAQYVHPEPLGIKSQVMAFWPTIFYPILYPWISGFIGLLLSLVASAFLLLTKRRRRIHAEE